jgi:hypothetical protein
MLKKIKKTITDLYYKHEEALAYYTVIVICGVTAFFMLWGIVSFFNWVMSL